MTYRWFFTGLPGTPALPLPVEEDPQDPEGSRRAYWRAHAREERVRTVLANFPRLAVGQVTLRDLGIDDDDDV